MGGRIQSRCCVARHRILQVGLSTLLGLALLGSNGTTASASPIRSYGIVVTNIDSLGPAWARFLSFGPEFWENHAPPPFPSGLILPTQNGLLVETPFVEYLLWRRNLDPARFDHYHPIRGPQLELLTPAVTSAILTPPTILTPPVTSPAIVPSVLPQVPEPSTLMIAAALMGSAFGWGLLKRRRG
jgi:hypothetical protein